MARLENTFSWSASRDRLFRDCPRAYYYAYYGSWGGWERGADPRVRRIYYLKNLTTLPMWIGKRVHDAAEALLRAVRAGRRADARAAAEAMVERMRDDYRDSKRDRASEDPKRATRFFEHHYGDEPPRERWARERDAAVSCVLALERLDILRTLQGLVESGREPFLALENLETWQFEGTPVFVRLDLAYHGGNDRVHIVDWKTGRRKSEPNPLQMLGYAAYAAEAWGLEPEQLDVREVYLRLPEDPFHHCPVTSRILEDAHRRIAASIRDMKALLADVEANTAREDDFPLTETPSSCRRCFFREVCPEPRC